MVAGWVAVKVGRKAGEKAGWLAESGVAQMAELTAAKMVDQ